MKQNEVGLESFSEYADMVALPTQSKTCDTREFFEDSSQRYWEERARKYVGIGRGLRAVCSYGMPSYYNAYIHATQWLALTCSLKSLPNRPSKVLDVGCGIGRWSQLLARMGANVTGIDFCPTMISEARRRVRSAELNGRCQFQVADLVDLDLRHQFDTITCITVLQHILGTEQVESSIQRLAAHLSPQGRLMVLEVAPSVPTSCCDSPVFVARSAEDYLQAFHKVGLRCSELSGVDPTPLKTLFLPWYSRLPSPIKQMGLAAVTAASLPIDFIGGRMLGRWSWHKLFVLSHFEA